MGKLIEEKQYECDCNWLCNQNNKLVVTKMAGFTEIEFIHHIGCIDEQTNNLGIFNDADIENLIPFLK